MSTNVPAAELNTRQLGTQHIYIYINNKLNEPKKPNINEDLSANQTLSAWTFGGPTPVGLRRLGRWPRIGPRTGHQDGVDGSQDLPVATQAPTLKFEAPGRQPKWL